MNEKGKKATITRSRYGKVEISLEDGTGYELEMSFTEAHKRAIMQTLSLCGFKTVVRGV